MRKSRRSGDSGFNVWRSYSDMMAGVLLLFVLIMCVTLFQAQRSYDESIKERDEKIALQEQYTAELLAQQNTLDEQKWLLEDQDEQLKDQEDQLSQQHMLLAEQEAQLRAQREALQALEARLNAQQVTLDEQSEELENQRTTLAAQQEKLGEQEITLAAQQKDITDKTNLLAEQQRKIDNIIGVKAEVVESLRQEFSANRISVNIDENSGAMTLDANVLFEVAEWELTDEGMDALYQVLPIYLQVLLSQQYRPYLAEIIIDGYTDTDGSYAYNLELSQQRSLAVAEYLLEIEEDFLSGQESLDLESFLTVNGHSESNPVLNPDGSVNMDASRRVEVKFRLKDDEMIQELNAIMTNEAA